MNIFAVWFKIPDRKKMIVGISPDKREAYRMARDLYAIKKNIDGEEDVSTGVDEMEAGKLYTSLRAKSAQVTPLLTSMI